MLKIKNKRLFKAVFSVFMVIVICLATMGSVPIKVYSAYIDPALEKVLSRAEGTDLIPVDIWLYDIDTEEVDEKVFAKTGLNREIISDEKRSADLTHEQVDAYIEAERTFYAEAQTKRSNEFLKQYSNIFTSKATENSEIFYVSKYAPSIQMELTPAQIAKLAKDLSVESIYYLNDSENVNCSDIANFITSADYVRDTLSLNGDGIKIGMIEAKGLPNRNHSFFITSNIVYDPSVDQDMDEHADLVAAVMVAQPVTEDDITYKGIVPNAMLYATWSETVLGNPRCAEWLLSQGVNVINISLGANNFNGSYTSQERWFDHIALQHSVHIVVSAGNEGLNSKYVTPPGMSYNAITVGNLDDSYTAKHNDDTIAFDSSYLENYNTRETPEKPDLVAPGTNITTPAGTGSGTSFAAPHVAAIVAQMCQVKPALKTLQDVMKSILVATTSHTYHTYTPSEANFEEYGAGLVNAKNAHNTASKTKYFSSSFAAKTANNTIKTHSFTLNATNSIVRVALSWLNYISIPAPHEGIESISGCTIADLTLRVKNSSGTILGTSSTHGNVEIIELTNLSAGTYTIEVIQTTNSAKTVYYGVAWW